MTVQAPSEKQKKKRGPVKRHTGKLPPFSGVDLTSLTDDYINCCTQPQGRDMQPVLDENGLAMLSSSTSILKVHSIVCIGKTKTCYAVFADISPIILEV